MHVRNKDGFRFDSLFFIDFEGIKSLKIVQQVGLRYGACICILVPKEMVSHIKDTDGFVHEYGILGMIGYHNVDFYYYTMPTEIFSRGLLNKEGVDKSIIDEFIGESIDMYVQFYKAFMIPASYLFEFINDEYVIKISEEEVLKKVVDNLDEILLSLDGRFPTKELDVKELEFLKYINYLRSMSYTQYLKTEHWKDTRKNALKRAGNKCQLCGERDKQLHVHHNNYENRGREKDSDLIVLCSDCHAKFHDKFHQY